MGTKTQKIENKTDDLSIENGTIDSSSDKNDDVIEALKVQYREYTKQAEDAKIMALKALGALEVLTSIKEQGGKDG